MPINVAFNGTRHRVALYIGRTPAEAHCAPLMLVVFMDGGPIMPADEEFTGEEPYGATEIQRLRQELRQSEERYRRVIEDTGTGAKAPKKT